MNARRAGLLRISPAILALLLAACGSPDEPPQATGGYAGTEACKECHAEQHRAFVASHHRKYVQTASPDTVIGDFATNNSLEAGDAGTTMLRRGDDFFVKTTGPDGALHEYRVEKTIGFHFKQRYETTLADGRRYVLPVQWNKNQKKWVDYHGLKKHKPGDGAYWSDPERGVATGCAGCHGTGVRLFRGGADGRPRIVEAECTIGCEACHGPCADHCRDDKNEDYIKAISLKGLSPQRRTDVCGSCHGRGQDPDAGTSYPHAFLPGSRLLRTFDLVEAVVGKKTGRFWADGRSSSHHQQYIDHVQSKHYTRAGMDCLACHTHHERKGQGMLALEPGQRPNELCTQCHEDLKANDALKAHTGHDPLDDKEKDGTICVDCHMPKIVANEQPMQLRHHGISIPNPRKTLLWGTPNACNICHNDPATNDTPQRMIDAMTRWGFAPPAIKVKVKGEREEEKTTAEPAPKS